MANTQPAATAGQPLNNISIDANAIAALQRIFPQFTIPGQPVQQTFQQPTPGPAPAGTMAAMGGNEGWKMQQQTPYQIPNQGQYSAMPQQPLTAAQASRMAAANGQTEPGSPLERQMLQQQLQAFDNLLTQNIDSKIERRLIEMGFFGNNQQQGIPQQQMMMNGQVQQSFFDTTTGKVVIGAGGVGIGVLGTKLFSSAFGGGNNSTYCTANDMNALVNAFKQLLK